MMTTGTEQEELLQFLYMCPVGVLELDNGGRVRRINPEGANVLAATLGFIDLQELLPVLELYAPDLIPLVTDPNGPIGRLVEDRMVQVSSPQRGIATISMTLVRVDSNRLMLVVSDQTRTARARRLESLGQLAGGIAHDFNNLLGVILLQSSFVASGIGDVRALIGDARWKSLNHDVTQISSTVERGERLTRRLLAFARREPTYPEVIAVDTLITGMLELTARTLGSHITVDAELSAATARVNLDPGQLEQAMLNLLVNSRNAMPDGGRLKITTQLVRMTAAHALSHTGLSAGVYVRIAVTDTGLGMTPEVLARAFDPFFTTSTDGSGLGLATVYSIISNAGGHVELISEPGQGTTAIMLLPVYEDPRG